MRWIGLLLATSLTLSLAAQQPSATTRPQAPQHPAAPRPDPQVNPDRTVTFHYADPAATSVTVELDLPAKVVLTKDASGVWTGTSAALAPEWYSYHFDVDGRTELDPNNVYIKSSLTGVGDGFLVPGQPAEPWEEQAVAHGTLHHHFYTTHVVQGLKDNQSNYYVYTPAGYNPRGTTKYPVLYLLHGWSDTAAGWSEIGQANQILDNLIATGKVKPMVVVMPLGYGDMSFVRSGFTVWNDPAVVAHNTGLFKQTLLTEVLPAVELEYNVYTDREHRAITGLSMGGLESLTIGLTDSKQFAWVGGFSSAVHKVQPGDFSAADAKEPLDLLWIACGTSDQLFQPNQKLIADLKGLGYPVTAIATPGVHSWLVWRDNLVHFLPLLFQH